MAPAARRTCSSSARFIPCGLAIDLPPLDRSEASANRAVLTQALSFLGFVEQNASDFGPGALQDRHPLHRRKVAALDPSRTDLPGMLESLPHGIVIDLRHDEAGHRQAATVDGVVRLHDHDSTEREGNRVFPSFSAALAALASGEDCDPSRARHEAWRRSLDAPWLPVGPYSAVCGCLSSSATSVSGCSLWRRAHSSIAGPTLDSLSASSAMRMSLRLSASCCSVQSWATIWTAVG